MKHKGTETQRGASQGCKLVVGASRSLARSRRFETFVLRTGYANPLRFFLQI